MTARRKQEDHKVMVREAHYARDAESRDSGRIPSAAELSDAVAPNPIANG
jgi:hypothetical protein